MQSQTDSYSNAVSPDERLGQAVHPLSKILFSCQMVYAHPYNPPLLRLLCLNEITKGKRSAWYIVTAQ